MNTLQDRKFPVMEWPIIAFFLAIAAGSMDGFTYFTTQSFSTVQSGNVILIGQSIAAGDYSKLLTITLTVLSFGLGAFSSQLIAFRTRRSDRMTSAAILLLEITLLALLTFPFINSHIAPSYTAMIISFIAGIQGNTFHKLAGMPYGNVAVTLVVQNAFSFAARGLTGRAGAWQKSAFHFMILAGFALGGWIGTVLTRLYQEKTFWFTILVLIGLIVMINIIKESEPEQPIDP